MSAFDRLISQIDSFIRKFYKNQIIKGLILFVGVFLVTYLFVASLEYFGRFSSSVRGFLFFGFLLSNLFILSKYIIFPLLKLKSFGDRINRMQASKVIGSFFPSISDRLVNTLQLNDQMNHNSADFELLNASVQQRCENMNAIPFADAINFKENKKYAAWVVPVILVVLSVAILSPKLFTQGTERVVNFTEEFIPLAPFSFELLASNEQIEEGEDFNFSVQLEGETLPDKVYVSWKQGRFLLIRKKKNIFKGTLPQLHESTKFHFEAPFNNDVVKSETFNIHVEDKAVVGKIQAKLIYPKYLDLENETIENAADLSIPEGTVVTWSVLTRNTKQVEFYINSEKEKFTNDGFEFTRKFKVNSIGKLVLTNKSTLKTDTNYFDIEVTKDAYPSILVEEVIDTLKDGVRYFSGVVGDDHGVSALKFNYTITNKEGNSRNVSLSGGKVFGTESPFNFAVDFRREEIQLDDKIEYYFTIFDNDGVNGSKSTRSRVFTYKLPSLEELNEDRSKEQEKLKKDLQEVLEKTQKFNEDVEKLKKDNQNNSNSSWKQENQVKQLQEDHKSLVEDVQKLQEEMQNSMEEKNQLSEMDKELMEQQELINDLLEELMDDELKDLLEQLEELMKQQNKEGVEENMEELEMSSEDMKKQLDRSLEMLKRLQVNERVDDIEEELKKLAEEQRDLKEETKDSKSISEEQKEAQQKIEDKFEKIKESIEEIDSLNQELDNPMELGNPEKDAEEVSEQLEGAQKQMDKNNGGKAGESQEGAADKMEEMAENLDANQASSNQQQQEEDIDMLRNILESLVTLSLDQEEVMNSLQRVSNADPAFLVYGRKQRKIIDDTKIVRDSLYALATRNPKIAKFIDKELNQITKNHNLSLEDIDERRRHELTIHQQYAMTSYNNLALMLNESLQDMQEQMRNSKPGSGKCNKPGGKGKPKPGDGMSSEDMKQALKKQLESMKKGPNSGGKKPGDKPGKGEKGGQGMMRMSNEQIAKMSAEQGAIRRRLEQMRKDLNKDGSGKGNQLNPLIEELKQQEEDLINKRFNRDLVKRQQSILTRLLESEKALMERGLDEKRESKSGKKENYSNQIQFDEYNKEKLKQIELLRNVNPEYKKYYRDKANQYFNEML